MIFYKINEALKHKLTLFNREPHLYLLFRVVLPHTELGVCNFLRILKDIEGQSNVKNLFISEMTFKKHSSVCAVFILQISFNINILNLKY